MEQLLEVPAGPSAAVTTAAKESNTSDVLKDKYKECLFRDPECDELDAFFGHEAGETRVVELVRAWMGANVLSRGGLLYTG